ncbi:hypothetical protein [Pseudaquabacterium rugosum]|jgi:hypothetical protein|uniref:Uncharacterized protein n=1 Tax=Pseudaquabacterium rugosum TaxID=2984194 RepID=A0ABU9BJD8_9BURK
MMELQQVASRLNLHQLTGSFAFHHCRTVVMKHHELIQAFWSSPAAAAGQLRLIHVPTGYALLIPPKAAAERMFATSCLFAKVQPFTHEFHQIVFDCGGSDMPVDVRVALSDPLLPGLHVMQLWAPEGLLGSIITDTVGTA